MSLVIISKGIGVGGVMFWRGLVLAVAAVLLCGCETERNGLDYAAMTQKLGPPRPGQARIVVLREKGYAGIADPGWDVMLDGGPMSDLKTGTYVYADRPAGPHQLSASAALFPGVSRYDVSAQSGRTYFFLVRPSERAKVLAGMSAAGGVAGLLVGAAVTSGNNNPGRSTSFRWRKWPQDKPSQSFGWRNSVGRRADWRAQAPRGAKGRR